MSRLHLLGSGCGGLLTSGGLLGSGALLLGSGEKREAGQNRRKTDRPGNQVLSSHLTAPIQPHQKSNWCPSCYSILNRRNSQ